MKTKDPELAEQLDERFATLQALLDEQRDGDGFVLYTELTPTRSSSSPTPSTR